MTPRRFDAALEKARRWCADQFKRRYDARDDGHASYLASRILREAAKKFELDSSGVEGWASEVGDKGWSYLNFGDPYVPTIMVMTTRTKARFYYSRDGWSKYAGNQRYIG